MAEPIKTVQNVLFATDLGKESAHAIPWVVWWHRHCGATIHVLHGLDVPPVGLGGVAFTRQKDQASQRLRRFLEAQHLNKKGINPVVVAGDVAVLVEKFVRESEIDLIVLGSRSKGLGRLFAGSTSEEIFRSVDCPVLTVGPKAVASPPAGGLKRLLFATDLGKGAKATLKRVEPILQMGRSVEIALAHFLSSEAGPVVERYKRRRRLQAELTGLVPGALRGQVGDIVVESSSPAEGIVQFAREQHSDLIILRVRSGGPYLRAVTHVRPSITHQVIQSAACPVLTVRD